MRKAQRPLGLIDILSANLTPVWGRRTAAPTLDSGCLLTRLSQRLYRTDQPRHGAA
ncbi:hypothetical protein EMIT0194MI4_70114 [Pseudomonas sp. IT-194MI4]